MIGVDDTLGSDLTFTTVCPPTVVTADKSNPADAKLILESAGDADTWGETKLALDAKFDEGTDYKSPCPMGAAALRKAKDGEQRVVVLGSHTIGCNYFLENVAAPMRKSPQPRSTKCVPRKPRAAACSATMRT